MCTSRVKGKRRKIVRPRKMCSLKIRSASATSSQASVRKVKMRLRPGHEVAPFRRRRDAAARRRWCSEAEHELDDQQHQDADVGEARGGADARVVEAAVQQHHAADQREDRRRRRRRGWRGSCLKPWLMPRVSKNQSGVRRPTRWPKKTIEHADVEQHRAQNELLAAQELARTRLPGEGIALVAGDRAEREDGERDVGIDLEQEEVHVRPP